MTSSTPIRPKTAENDVLALSDQRCYHNVTIPALDDLALTPRIEMLVPLPVDRCVVSYRRLRFSRRLCQMIGHRWVIVKRKTLEFSVVLCDELERPFS